MLDASRQLDVTGKTIRKNKRLFRVEKISPGARQIIKRPVTNAPPQTGAGQDSQITEALQVKGVQPVFNLIRPAGNATGQNSQCRLHGRQFSMNLTGSGLCQPARPERTGRNSPV